MGTRRCPLPTPRTRDNLAVTQEVAAWSAFGQHSPGCTARFDVERFASRSRARGLLTKAGTGAGRAARSESPSEPARPECWLVARGGGATRPAPPCAKRAKPHTSGSFLGGTAAATRSWQPRLPAWSESPAFATYRCSAQQSAPYPYESAQLYSAGRFISSTALLFGLLTPPASSVRETEGPRFRGLSMVERTGIEPVTSGLQSRTCNATAVTPRPDPVWLSRNRDRALRHVMPGYGVKC
jgi:hypothetical protein